VSNKPLIKMSFKRGETTHSVLSIWRGKFPGTYSVSRDKGTEKFPPISIIDVLKAFAAGEGFVNVSVESEREWGDSKPRGNQQSGGDFNDAQDPMGNADIPF
jgi:hypothetical protein